MRDYKVQFIDDQAFDRLPGHDMGSKVGVAYPEYGQAFVRKSGSTLVDAFTMAHELEHLSGNDLDEHYDTENKCYYKGFGEVLTNIGAAIPGPWQPFAQGGSAVMGAQSAQRAQRQQQNQQRDQQQAMQQMLGQGGQEQQPQPNVIQAPGMGGQGGQGGISSPGAAAGRGPANAAADQMGYYQSRSPMAQFGGM